MSILFFEAEWGEDFEYNVGDNTYISDPELFGYNQITRTHRTKS